MLKKVVFFIEYLPEHELAGRVFMELWRQGIEAERKNPEEAEKLLTLAAEQGNTIAMRKLALLYLREDFFPADYKKAFEISEALRSQKYIVEKDIFARSFKAQMKYADKIGAKNLLVIGEEELKTNTAKIKNMISGEEKEVSLDVESIKNVL